jgi:hypothetical protein
MIIQLDYARLYYNCGDDPDKLWSIDSGLSTAEICFAAARIYHCIALTEFDQDALKGSPRAWLALRDVTLDFSNPQCCEIKQTGDKVE